MNVTLHLPQTPQGLQNLKIQVSALYAKGVIEQIQKLSCPTEQKLDLIKEIEKACKAKENP